MGLLSYESLNYKMTIEQAIEWSHNRSNIYDNRYCFVVCKFNYGYIIQTLKYVLDHVEEYDMNDIVYCTNYERMEEYLTNNLASS